MARMFIGGESVDSESGEVYEVRNPANGETVDTVPKGTAGDARRAIEAAEKAFESWSEVPGEARARILMRAAGLIEEHAEEISVLLTREQGKPVAESRRELEHFLHGMHFVAELGAKIRGAQVPLADPKMYGMVLKRPIGVCAAISPWNFPITLMGTKINPALITGNTVVHKPASTTPLAAIRIIELMHEAGVPAGAVNVVTGPGSVVGEELVRNPRVRRVAFTGETVTGRHIMQVAGPELKRITLELGGSDPMIVCDDADLDRASAGASVGRYYNCGQACLAVKRLYVFDSVYDAFVERMVGRVKRLTVADPMSPQTRLGPLHTAGQRQEIEEQVQDAIERGAQVLAGGQRPEGEEFARGNYYQATLLADVPDDARAVQEETFGPVLPVFRVKDLDEAIERANNSPYGLGSSIWTRDLRKANRAAEKLQAGNVWINSLHIGFDELPFGGVKGSGIGREHGPEALEYYLEPKGVVYAIPD